MLVLLPPSETKKGRSRGKPVDQATLSFPSLTGTRTKVAAALADVSARDDAAEVLKVSPSLGDEVARNLELTSAPSLPAGQCYTGVLYDALDLPSLATSARRRASRRLVVVSALYGAVRPGDRIAPYRLSMGVNLPGVGPLASVWRSVLDPELSTAAGRGLVVDCRSSTYAAAWTPGPELAHRWVTIRVPGATHLAKHTRGLVARALCASSADPRRPEGLADLLAEDFDVQLHPQSSPRRPHVLDVSAPG